MKTSVKVAPDGHQILLVVIQEMKITFIQGKTGDALMSIGHSGRLIHLIFSDREAFRRQ